MKIIFNESRKILNPRLTVVLIIFTVLYYYLFIGLPTLYAHDDQETKERVLYLRMYEEFGPTISAEEYDTGVQNIKNDLMNQANELVRRNPVFSKMGINNYDEYRKYKNKVLDKENASLTATEKEFGDASSKFTVDDKPSSDLVFQIQRIEALEEAYESEESSSLSTLSDALAETVRTDMLTVGRLILICCMVLLVPYYIGERRSGVLPLYAASKTGRKIFAYQVVASMISCSMVFLLQAVAYTVLGFINDIFLFWDCPAMAWYNPQWVNLTFGQYYLVFFAFIWVLTMTTAIIGYLVSRKAANYVIGVAMGIPVVMVGWIYFGITLREMFSINFSLFRHWMIPMCLLAMVIVVLMVLRRDKKRDL